MKVFEFELCVCFVEFTLENQMKKEDENPYRDPNYDSDYQSNVTPQKCYFEDCGEMTVYTCFSDMEGTG